MKVFTWHVHGNYLFYLTQIPVDWYLPKGSKTKSFPWGRNVHEIEDELLPSTNFDFILLQSRQNYEVDQYRLFGSSIQPPRIYIEHDPPREHPTDTHHFINDGTTTIIHVTYFNQLMWDNGNQPNLVIEHGVQLVKPAEYLGDWDRGVVVINNLSDRGRRLGNDIYLQLSKIIPLDLIGSESLGMGGLGEITPKLLPPYLSRYRFIFSPIRYTSLGLSLIEAMMIGLPVVGLATTELASVIQNNVHGFISTNLNSLINYMKLLLKDHALALRISTQVKHMAEARFSIHHFKHDWMQLFHSLKQNTVLNQSTAARINL